jgi:hypothetical protein
MVVNEVEKRRIIDLHFKQGKTIREICRIMGKSSHYITPVTKKHRIHLAQNYALANGEQRDIVQREQDRVIPNVKAYKLFDEGKSPYRSNGRIEPSRATGTANAKYNSQVADHVTLASLSVTCHDIIKSHNFVKKVFKGKRNEALKLLSSELKQIETINQTAQLL